jgi:peptidoglycan/LPS O-acetylase OafA/YrhL
MPTNPAPDETGGVERVGTPDHLPRLDGLRAMAVFAVLLFHAEYFYAGWIGVQVFFVLSGFLITRILVSSKRKAAGQAGEFFGRFYWRRTLRIFPLYFAFLGVLAVAFAITRWPPHFAEASPWLFTYTINFARLAPDWPYTPAFGHLWSLAVEEQFYLLWPAAVWLLSERKLHRLIIAMIVSAPLLRLLTASGLAGWAPNPDLVHIGTGVYSLLSSHLDAFGLGAGLAVGFPLLVQRPLQKLLACLAVLFVAGLITLQSLRSAGLAGWSSLGYPHALAWHHQYLWAYTLINLASVWLIALLTVPTSRRSALQILEHPVPAYLGKISYGIYVWHAPIMALTAGALHVPHYQPLGLVGLLASTAATIALAAACFHGFESWFLKLKDLRPWASRAEPSLAISQTDQIPS